MVVEPAVAPSHAWPLPGGAVTIDHPDLGRYYLHAEDGAELLFCDNETNAARLYGRNGATAYSKDAFHDYVIHGRRDAVNAQRTGTKAAAHYTLTAAAGGVGARAGPA